MAGMLDDGLGAMSARDLWEVISGNLQNPNLLNWTDGFRGMQEPPQISPGLEGMLGAGSNYQLKTARDQASRMGAGRDSMDQRIIGPYEHRAFERELVGENPLWAIPETILNLGYTPAKALGMPFARGRSPASWSEMGQGFKGIGEGMLNWMTGTANAQDLESAEAQLGNGFNEKQHARAMGMLDAARREYDGRQKAGQLHPAIMGVRG